MKFGTRLAAVPDIVVPRCPTCGGTSNHSGRTLGPNVQLRTRHYPSFSRRMYQCLRCGGQIVHPIPRSAPSADHLPAWDDALLERWRGSARVLVEIRIARRNAARREAWFADHAEYIASPEWAAKREAVIARDGGTCRRCGRPGNHVHHVTYARLFDEALEDLELLCIRCHEAHHERAFA